MNTTNTQINLNAQKVAELYQQSRKQHSSTHTQSNEPKERRNDFQLWFQGFQSCIQLIGQQQNMQIPTVSSEETYGLVEKQQKAA